jgi:hypothetical protein
MGNRSASSLRALATALQVSPKVVATGTTLGPRRPILQLEEDSQPDGVLSSSHELKTKIRLDKADLSFRLAVSRENFDPVYKPMQFPRE